MTMTDSSRRVVTGVAPARMHAVAHRNIATRARKCDENAKTRVSSARLVLGDAHMLAAQRLRVKIASRQVFSRDPRGRGAPRTCDPIDNRRTHSLCIVRIARHNQGTAVPARGHKPSRSRCTVTHRSRATRHSAARRHVTHTRRKTRIRSSNRGGVRWRTRRTHRPRSDGSDPCTPRTRLSRRIVRSRMWDRGGPRTDDWSNHRLHTLATRPGPCIARTLPFHSVCIRCRMAALSSSSRRRGRCSGKCRSAVPIDRARAWRGRSGACTAQDRARPCHMPRALPCSMDGQPAVPRDVPTHTRRPRERVAWRLHSATPRFPWRRDGP